MKSYNRNSKTGGARDFNSRDYSDGPRRNTDGRTRYSGGNHLGKPALHFATCTSCGADCEVPFRPTGNKPVLCASCFKKNGTTGSRDFGNTYEIKSYKSGRDPRESDNKTGEPFKKQFEILNSKLDKILEILASDEKITQK